MVQPNVAGRCTFTNELPLARVEETELSLYCPEGEEINTSGTKSHFTLYRHLLSVQVVLLCPGVFHRKCVAVPLGTMRGCQEVTEQAGSSWQLCCLIHNGKVIRSW